MDISYAAISDVFDTAPFKRNRLPNQLYQNPHVKNDFYTFNDIQKPKRCDLPQRQLTKRVPGRPPIDRIPLPEHYYQILKRKKDQLQAYMEKMKKLESEIEELEALK